MTPLQTIREAVVKAVPEILELKFGVPFIYTEEDRTLNQYIFLEESANGSWAVWDIEQGDVFSNRDFVPELVQILGRPIQLADVLRTIGKVEIGAAVDTLGNVSTFSGKSFRWNLSLPLDSQSPETLQFLAEILK